MQSVLLVVARWLETSPHRVSEDTSLPEWLDRFLCVLVPVLVAALSVGAFALGRVVVRAFGDAG